jgi:hypothetical protein
VRSEDNDHKPGLWNRIKCAYYKET